MSTLGEQSGPKNQALQELDRQVKLKLKKMKKFRYHGWYLNNGFAMECCHHFGPHSRSGCSEPCTEELLVELDCAAYSDGKKVGMLFFGWDGHFYRHGRVDSPMYRAEIGSRSVKGIRVVTNSVLRLWTPW